MRIYTNIEIKEKIEKRKRVKNIMKYISYPIILLILICSASIIYQKVVLKESSISLFGYKPYIVLSGSMEPFIHVGDMVISKKVSGEEINIGDIITFEGENKSIITHRVVDIITNDGKKFYQTKGDNNNSKDIGLISFENIKGKYSLKINNFGKTISKIITPTGLLFIIFIITIIYISISKKSDRKIARHMIRERYKTQNNN